MTLTLVMPVDAHPACARPEHLALVDAAFDDPGGPESHWMRERLCPGCPVRRECLLLGNAKGEHGVWGGITSKQRANAGGRSVRTSGNWFANLVGIDHGRDARSNRRAS